jgi:hypothetical protein
MSALKPKPVFATLGWSEHRIQGLFAVDPALRIWPKFQSDLTGQGDALAWHQTCQVCEVGRLRSKNKNLLAQGFRFWYNGNSVAQTFDMVLPLVGGVAQW